MAPSANRQCWQSMVSQLCFTDFLFRVRSAITIGAGCIGAPIGVAEYMEDACFRCASPIFIPIAYKLSLTNRKRKYVAEKTTGPLKSKQTLITTVRCPILSVARLPTPLIFRYPLPLKVDGNEKWGGSGRKQKISFCPALWWSGVILNLNVPFLLKFNISVSACYSFLNRHCLDK